MKPALARPFDPIATLRGYTSILPTTLARSTAAEAVDALEAELAALRTPTGAITTRAAEVLEPLCVAEEQKRALFVLIASATQLRTSAETMSHELAALRESALDLSRVPEGWAFSDLCAPGLWDDGGIDYLLQLDKIDGDLPDFVDGTGLTPKAALNVAIKRAKERT